MSPILAEISSSQQILQIILEMPAVLSEVAVISVKITLFALVRVLVEHLLGTLSFIAVFLHQVDLASRSGELSVRIKLFFAFTHISPAFLAVPPVMVISFIFSFTLASSFDYIRFLSSFISVVITLATLILSLLVLLFLLRLAVTHDPGWFSISEGKGESFGLMRR